MSTITRPPARSVARASALWRSARSGNPGNLEVTASSWAIFFPCNTRALARRSDIDHIGGSTLNHGAPKAGLGKAAIADGVRADRSRSNLRNDSRAHPIYQRLRGR